MKSLCDTVSELSSRYYHKAVNEPKRLYGRFREDPFYFASVGAAFIVPTLSAAIAAYVMEQHDYFQDDITSCAIWVKNAGFFIVNMPKHLLTHRKKFENLADVLRDAGIIFSSNLFGLVVNTIAQPVAHAAALEHGITDPWAVLLTYPVIGGAVTYLKVLYDDFKGAVGLKKKKK